MEKRKVAILGSTGSIGRQALEVIGAHPELFEVALLTANDNYALLAEQAVKFDANNAVICNGALYDKCRSLLEGTDVKLFCGMDSVCSLLEGDSIDIVLTAVVGFSGLRPTVAAIRSGKTIALANKETLVAAGSLVTGLAARHSVALLPVDSEHSAIFQCLQGSYGAPVEKLIITASGGPFRNCTAEELQSVTLEQALKHPKWKMGRKITIDSATLMNKGLEVIEARWLFDMPAEKIEVVVHPESVIHSMVQFTDGAVIAQMGIPDMRLPIQYALTFPYRQSLDAPRLDFPALGRMAFHAPDTGLFPCLALAYEALSKGGNSTCVLNSANEEAVSAFMDGRIGFTDIPEVISRCLAKAGFEKEPDLDTIFATDTETRRIAAETIRTLSY